MNESVLIDPNQIRYFLACLFGAVEADSRLVLSYANSDSKLRSEWIKPGDIEAAVKFFATHAENRSTYYGVGLRDPRAYEGTKRRGGIAAVTQMVALWADIDIRGDGHKEEALPETKEQAIQLVYDATRPLQPSLIVFTGGGVHPYWLFREPFVITNDADRKHVQDLSKRINRQIVLMAEQHGWEIDSLHNLDRVLRVPGATNKYGGLVAIEQDNAIRYNLDTLDANLTPLPKPATMGPGTNLSGLDITAIAEAYAVVLERKSATELEGAHPVHGSTTGDNFNINPEKQTWHCWRHGSGGDALYLIAMAEGLIQCRDVQPGAMAGEAKGGTREGGRIFVQAAKIANERFGGRIELKGKANTGDSSSTGISPNSDSLPWSDYTNGVALVRNFGADLRYCYPWKKWLEWTGTHWQPDNSGGVMRRAKETAKLLARRIEGLDDIEAKALMGHIKRSLSAASLQAMIICAQSEEGIPVQPEDLDRDPWLLNCLNGTLDLRTGQLRPHARDDQLTQCIKTPYDANAKCPTWDRFLWRIMGGAAVPDSPDDSAAVLEARQQADDRARDLIDFLQKAVGYSLTGDTREECLFILYGTGQNGKSKFIGALHDLLEGYGQSTHSKTFMYTDKSDSIPNDLARMRGARFVSAIELGKDRRLNEELVKRATGRDPITARFLHAEWFDFIPQFKVFMASNYLPKISSIDKAMWRRLHQVPFTVTIPDDEKDEQLGEKLRAELPGILAWAVRGCMRWQKEGLKPPGAVVDATEAYKSDMDTIGRFIDECCFVSTNAQAKASNLYKAYTEWCAENGERYENQKGFGNYLQNKGFDTRRSNGVWRLGIGLNETTL